MDQILAESRARYPGRFYRYQPPDTERAKQIILDNTLYFPKPTDFNDPFDCFIKFDESGTPKEWKDKINTLYKKYEPSIKKKERERLVAQHVITKKYEKFKRIDRDQYAEDIGILSLCENNNNILLWAHYADKHRGICYEFSGPRDHFILGIGMVYPVQYCENYPIYKYVKCDLKNAAIELMITKSLDWEYEKEWRVIRFSSKTSSGYGPMIFHPSFLTGIIFGLETSFNFRDEIYRLTRRRETKINISQAVRSDSQFGLDIIRLFPEP